MGELMMNAPMQSAMKDLVGRYCRAEYFPSACVRIFDSSRTPTSVCVDEVGEDSLFDLASVTIIATTTGILKLIDEKSFILDDEVSAFFE